MWIAFGSRLSSLFRQIESLNQENIRLSLEVKIMRDYYEQEREERQHLNSLILQRTGFEYPSSNNESNATRPLPLGRAVTPWASVKAKLELHSKLSKVGSLTEEEWKNKEAQNLKEVDDLIKGNDNAKERVS